MHEQEIAEWLKGLILSSCMKLSLVTQMSVRSPVPAISKNPSLPSVLITNLISIFMATAEIRYCWMGAVPDGKLASWCQVTALRSHSKWILLVLALSLWGSGFT